MLEQRGLQLPARSFPSEHSLELPALFSALKVNSEVIFINLFLFFVFILTHVAETDPF